MTEQRVQQQVVMVGAGYAHLLLLRDWPCNNPAIELTLISPQTHVPYTGMLPAHIAGELNATDMHLDVESLCRQRKARFVLDRVVGLQCEQKQLQLASGKSINYDRLSLNIGPAAAQSVPGVADFAIAVKPASGFLPHWQECLQKLQQTETAQELVMTGGGAGSLEVLIAMAESLQQLQLSKHKLTLICAEQNLLPHYPLSVSQAAMQTCKSLGIKVLTGQKVSRVENFQLFTEDNLNNALHFDYLFWCTEAAAPVWLQYSGLSCDSKGFVEVNAGLQSISHPDIFAAGDIAAFTPRPIPKAGVFAVRQAPVLRSNLHLSLLGKPLQAYRPQAVFLSLLRLGPKLASGSYGSLGFSGRWVKRLKSRIDRQFINSFKSG